MIYIDRNKVAKPSSLFDKDGKGVLEKNDVIKFYKIKKNKSKAYKKYKAYKGKDIKQTLIDLFNGKCAYCESKILHIYPGDVEHFRPKASIKYRKEEKKDEIKPGYYWLASDWDNLLLACKSCNSPITHNLEDGTFFVTGKWDYFPLSDYSKHIDSPTKNVRAEERYRLLINPCVDKPEDYFEYDEAKGIILFAGLDTHKKLKADTSIQLYGLQRMQLVHERKIVISNCFIQIKRIEEAIHNLDAATISKDKARLTLILDREVSILKDYCKPTASYSAVAKQIFNKYFKAIDV